MNDSVTTHRVVSETSENKVFQLTIMKQTKRKRKPNERLKQILLVVCAASLFIVLFLLLVEFRRKPTSNQQL